MKNKKKFLIVLFIALVIKFSLFAYAEIYAPQEKFKDYDTKTYLEPAESIAKDMIFATKNENGTFGYNLHRTPGYPFFIAVLHGFLRIPYTGIILVQIFLAILAALITYKTAMLIDRRLAYLSALIVLFDPPITIFSLTLLTETLFLFLISIFMFLFILYLKKGGIKFILLSGLFLSLATYVRPVSYLLGIAMTLFIIYFSLRTKNKKRLVHALLFIAVVYSLIGIWQLRNYRVNRSNTFSSVTDYAKYYKKNIRNDDAFTQSLPPVPYYLNAVSRCFVSLMTNPGTLKNFGSRALTRGGKILAYPWMVFWLIGFLVGISKIENNFYLQFLSFVVVYFICASVGGVLFGVSSRLRVPMVPFIAILSANGWVWINSLAKRKKGLTSFA